MSDNYLRKFVSLFENTEVPEEFALWVGIASLSAMLERRVWVDMGIYTIYPNMFIVLVAESGHVRKSTAVNVAEKILRQTDPGPRIVAQKLTPEAMIDALKSYRTDDPNNFMQETCGGVIIADELMTLINRKSYDAALPSLLIQLYDCKTSFEYQTRGRGKEELFNTHLTILGASTANALREAIPPQAIGEGLTSRILFINAERVPEPVAWTTFNDAKRQAEEDVIKHLQTLAQLSGPVYPDDDVKKFFEEEYRRFYYNSPFYSDPNLSGYASRRSGHLMKIGMACMVAEDPTSTVMKEDHLRSAKVYLESAEKRMSDVLSNIVTSEAGDMTKKVYHTIKTKGEISRSELLKQFSHQLDARELSGIIETLKISGMIDIAATPTGGVVFRPVKGK